MFHVLQQPENGCCYADSLIDDPYLLHLPIVAMTMSSFGPVLAMMFPLETEYELV